MQIRIIKVLGVKCKSLTHFKSYNMNHQIKASDLQNFESKTQLAGQFGGEIHKALFLVTQISVFREVISHFQVEQDKMIVLSTLSLEGAVARYNSL
jgi:hypothetical protein